MAPIISGLDWPARIGEIMRLVPREEKYFGMLNQLAAQVKRGGELFVRIFEDYQNHARRRADKND